jgi:hypothetical protein
MRLLGLWLNDIIVAILGGQQVFGADGAGQTQQIKDNFSYCVMITRTSTRTLTFGGFKEGDQATEIYGFDRNGIAASTDLLKIDKAKRIPVGPFGETKELKTKLAETLKTLDETTIVRILTEIARTNTTVTTEPSVDYVDYKDPKIRLVSFERTGTLKLSSLGELKLEEVEGLFKTENEKIRASISQKCKATEGIKLLAKFVQVVEFNKATDSILFDKASASSPIYNDPEQLNTAKAELIVEITNLHVSKYEGITFSNDDKTQLLKWLDRREICRDEIEELDKRHWAATNSDIWRIYSQDDHFPHRLEKSVRENTLWASIERIVTDFIDAIKRFRAKVPIKKQ